MPELPEVETTRRGIEPHLAGQVITEVVVRRRDLRLPVSASLGEIVNGTALSVDRRSKYLIIHFDHGASVLVHLGMSGSLRLTTPNEPLKTHDHVVFRLSSGLELRFHDPRRFGMILHLPEGDPLNHPLLAKLGPEPLENGFTSDMLARALSNRSIPIKVALMDAQTVVGVGNIYASEALFRAGIRPGISAKAVSKARLARLTRAIKEVLQASIEQGGTTLRDFVNSDGQPGYFQQTLLVYGREGKPCRICQAPIRQAVMGQRSTYWCPRCQR